MTFEIDEAAYIEHYGVKGMQWGVRKARTEGVSRRTDREAHKDAREFARAKQFFGEGAGTRRKLIKNSVESKSKRDSGYAKAFERHLADQDVSKHVTKAKSERKRTDRKTKNKQRLGALARGVTGQRGTQAAFVAVALTGAAFLSTPKGQRMFEQAANKFTSKAKNFQTSRKQKRGAQFLSDYFKRQGL